MQARQIYFVSIFTILLDLLTLSTPKNQLENQILKVQINRELTQKENFCQKTIIKKPKLHASKAKGVNAE